MAPRRWRTAPALVLENVQTGDGRVMSDGAIEWADLPLPLAWLRDGDQHVSLTEVAPQLGIIELIERRDAGIIYAEGTIDDENPDGAEVVRRMEAGEAPLGNRFPVSIDPDNWEVEIIATEQDEDETVLLVASGNGQLTRRSLAAAILSAVRAAAGDPDPGEGGGEDGVVLFEDNVDSILERYTRLRVRGATLCAVAAFDQAAIELVPVGAEETTPEDEPPAADSEAVAASTSASVEVPARPPASWFNMPEPQAGDELLVEQVDGSWAVPLTITDDGRVFGHIARRDQGHRGYVGRHVPPPTSATGYREFHVGQVVCEDGSRVATGALVVGCDHAPLSMRLLEARDHYANSGLGWADGRIVDGEFGPWFSGALRPGLNDDDLRVLRALAPSGDWRGSGAGLELVSVLSVNTPGFPVARDAMAASAIAASAATAPSAPGLQLEAGEVTSLVAAAPVARCSQCAERARERESVAAALGLADDVLETLGELRAGLAMVERRTRHLEPNELAALKSRVHL